jgi:hypothetical protein
MLDPRLAVKHQNYCTTWWGLEVALVVIDGNDGSGNSHFSSTTNGIGGDDETSASILGGDALLNVTLMMARLATVPSPVSDIRDTLRMTSDIVRTI